MAAGGGPRVGANVARRAALGSRQSVRYRSAGRIERLAAHGLRDVRDGGACFFWHDGLAVEAAGHVGVGFARFVALRVLFRQGVWR